MQGQEFVIKRLDGTELHRGTAQSPRRFLSGLFGARESFRDADLRGWKINNLIADGIDFRGADLSGANLAGASLCGADLTGATLRGVRADGLRALNARLVKIDLSPLVEESEEGPQRRHASLRGADLAGADLGQAVLDEADLSGATCRAARFLKAQASRTVFRGADLVNAQYGLSTFSACDFTGADMSTASGAPLSSLPDRTAGATVCDNVYGNAVLDEGAPAFGRDRRAGKLMRTASWGVSALAIAGLAGLLPEEAGIEWVRHAASHVAGEGRGALSTVVGNGLVILAAIKLASFVREAVEHTTREHIGKGVMRVLRAAKGYASEAKARGVEVGNLVVAAARGPGHGLVGAALAATAEGSLFREIVGGRARLVLCDRVHLARALVHLHVERTRDVSLDRDLLLVRVRDESPLVPGLGYGAPGVFRLGADGGASAAWRRGSRLLTASWGPHGELVSSHGFHGDEPSMESAKAAFEKALWADHGLRAPYLTKAHQIAAGRDGSIQVIEERTGLLSNPWGPAYIGRDGVERTFRKGREEEPAEPAEVAPVPGM